MNQDQVKRYAARGFTVYEPIEDPMEFQLTYDDFLDDLREKPVRLLSDETGTVVYREVPPIEC